MLRPTLSKKDASPRAVALLEALHEPFSVEERLWIIEKYLRAAEEDLYQRVTGNGPPTPYCSEPEPVEHG